MTAAPKKPPKPATASTPRPVPQPPKIEPYPDDIFIVEGKGLRSLLKSDDQ